MADYFTKDLKQNQNKQAKKDKIIIGFEDELKKPKPIRQLIWESQFQKQNSDNYQRQQDQIQKPKTIKEYKNIIPQQNKKQKIDIQYSTRNFFQIQSNQKHKEIQNIRSNELNLKKPNFDIQSQLSQCSQEEYVVGQKFFTAFQLILTNTQIQDYSIFTELNQKEKICLYWICNRKMKIKKFEKFKKGKNNDKLLIETIKKLLQFSSKKRFQENVQFLLKNFFQHKKKQLEADKIITQSTDTYRLIKHMFLNEARILKVPFTNFLDPLLRYKGKIKNKRFRTYGKEYMVFLFQSQNFKNEFLDFLNDKIFQFYEKKIMSKMKGIQEKIQTLYYQQPTVDKFLTTLKNHIIVKRQFKLPWRDIEIKIAVDQVFEKAQREF